MSSATIPTLVVIAIQLGLGLPIFYANPRRRANQCFLLLSVIICGWLASLCLAFSAKTPAVAEFSIRQANATGVLYLAALNLLRLAISRPSEGWGTLLRRSRFWLITTTAIVVLCQTQFFLKGATMPTAAGTVPVPIYGPLGIEIYSGYFVLAFLALIVSYGRAVRKATGSTRGELGFILIGGVAAMAIALLLTFVADAFMPKSQWMWFAPFRIIVFSLIVAYGIATKKILDVGLLLRRIISYTLLTLYLLGLYALAWTLLTSFLRSVHVTNATSMAHVVAGIIIAFAMAPARGISQGLAERLFISTQRVDFRATMNTAANILMSVTTLDDLLKRFATAIADAVKTDRIAILLHARDRFEQAYALQPPDVPFPTVSLAASDPLVRYLKERRTPIVLDELQRLRETAALEQVIIRMRTLKLAVVVGIFARDHLSGVMFLGPRSSGHIYGTTEQNALEVLCGQLAIAIDNAELFTEAQNAKIYNETLLENLTAGVIAASADERITVFNNEVERITGLDSRKVLDRSVDFLPDALRVAIRETLQTRKGVANRDITLNSAEGALSIRVSTSIFHGRDGSVLGALAVLTDITALKRLEFQIRRSDRLASLGTLSAGMAHEIKNPLVSIKTFAQLLPERYQDSDFRQTFSNLIGHEIDRIDSLVNQLLRFARPAKPQLEPRHVHQILEKSLLLVGHRLYQKDIKLTRSWEANVDTIRADADQLEQVFLNFFLNAMDAMKNGGELHITTDVRTDEELVTSFNQSNGQTHEVLRISIRDSGEGIKPEDLPHVFDPFFTTKDYGTGLGLSVVHGIIQEHGGQIEVESELNKGTAFHILLPLVRFDREVAAA
jgi:PAS domain S-box-containing protein